MPEVVWFSGKMQKPYFMYTIRSKVKTTSACRPFDMFDMKINYFFRAVVAQNLDKCQKFIKNA